MNGVKRQDLLKLFYNTNAELKKSYDEEGIIFTIDGKAVHIPKSSAFDLLTDDIMYLASFEEDRDELITFLANILDHISDDH